MTMYTFEDTQYPQNVNFKLKHYVTRPFFFDISTQMWQQNLFSHCKHPVWEKRQRYAYINKPILFTFALDSLNRLSLHGAHARKTQKSLKN